MSLFGNNVKVHFAGAENDFSFSLRAAGVKYALYSCFKYIESKKIGDDFSLPPYIKKSFKSGFKNVIQDSGLFTLMFGAKKHVKIDRDFLIDWQDKLIELIVQNNLNDVICVEIDCQKILGVKDAWFLRERMKSKLPNKQINVFHFEDGKEGLDRLIDFSDYIAISVPELRIIKPKTYRKDAVSLAEYCKSKNPKIDIHMLGCTEKRMLEDIKFCTSCDSTSWQQGFRYGYVKRRHINTMCPSYVKERKQIIEAISEKSFNVTDYHARASLCASICLNEYEKLAGSQN